MRRGESGRSSSCHSSSPAVPGPWQDGLRSAFFHDWKLELSCWR